MTKIEYEEIELSPSEFALNFYKYVRADVSEGLNYHITADAYNRAFEGIGSGKRTEARVPAVQFECEFREEWNRRAEKLRQNAAGP